MVISADGIDELLTFGAGADAPNRTDIVFNITDDDVALEAIERYIASLEVLPGSLGVQVGDPSETSVAILDDDGTYVVFSSAFNLFKVEPHTLDQTNSCYCGMFVRLMLFDWIIHSGVYMYWKHFHEIHVLSNV